MKLTDKVGAKLFETLIVALLNKYEKSTEKDTMSFEEYCRALLDLSINQSKKSKKE